MQTRFKRISSEIENRGNDIRSLSTQIDSHHDPSICASRCMHDAVISRGEVLTNYRYLTCGDDVAIHDESHWQIIFSSCFKILSNCRVDHIKYCKVII